jgi:NAD(P)-dependent dehydrogenase (short-subunit alcohol dehydrogenase family)
MTLQGKTALITGGSSGIGLATARLLQENGARVVMTGTDAGKLEAARAAPGGSALAIRADVTSTADLAALHDRLKDAFGTLDIVFANACVAFGTPIGATDEAM